MLTNGDTKAAFNEAVRSVDQAHHEYADGDFDKCHRLLSNAEWLIHQLQQNLYARMPATSAPQIRGGRRAA